MRYGILTLFLTCVVFGQDASAQECVAIENDLDRLACFDKQAGRAPTIEDVKVGTGNWLVRTETSEFEDTTNVYLMVTSDEGLRCRSYGAPKKATLYLRCLENTTSIYISTDCHLASGFQGYGQVDYRIDDKPSASRGFDASTNNRALGLWTGGSAIPFIKKLFGAKRLLVRFTPFNENPVTAKFDISGVEEAVRPLREACSW